MDFRGRCEKEENAEGKPAFVEEDVKIHRRLLEKEDSLQHGFAEGCSGCQAMLPGTPRHARRHIRRTGASTAGRRQPIQKLAQRRSTNS